MKKLFTLFAMLLAFTTTVNAKQVLTGSFNPWGETCTVDGNTITFNAAWSGAGWWLNYIDLSEYDCIVVKFAEPTVGNINICAQYGEATGGVITNEDGTTSPEYAINEAWNSTGTINSGSKIAKVDLNIEHSDLVAQFWVQGTVAGAQMVVQEVYVGYEEEYQADKDAAGKIQRADISLADLASGWGGSTYDSGTKTITIGDDWSGKGWWFGDADYSDFDYFVVKFNPATATQGKIMVECDGSDSGEDGAFNELCLQKVVALPEGKAVTKQFYIQGPAESTYTLAEAFVCTQTYLDENGLTDMYDTSDGINDMMVETTNYGAVYNLAGQRVGGEYKGVVVRNGRKFIQK